MWSWHDSPIGETVATISKTENTPSNNLTALFWAFTEAYFLLIHKYIVPHTLTTPKTKVYSTKKNDGKQWQCQVSFILIQNTH